MHPVERLIGQVAEHYRHQLAEFVEHERVQFPGGKAECKFRLADDTGLFDNLYCVDFAAKSDDELVVREMMPDKVLSFDPAEIEVRGASITIVHLVWDDVQLHHDAPLLELTQLNRWFEQWFDPDERRFKSGEEFGGIIHSLQIGIGQVDVDLGSAPPDAFWHMLDLITAAGATRIKITSSRELD